MKQVLVALVVLAAVASPGYALVLNQGPQSADFHDYSCLYDANGNAIGLSASTQVVPGVWVPTTQPVKGDTQRSIIYVNQIQDVDSNVEFNSSSPTMITGILADLKIVNVTATVGGTQFVLDFAPIVAPKDPNFGGLLNIYETSTKVSEATFRDPNGAGTMFSQLPTAAGAGVAIPALGGPNAFTGGLPPYNFPNITSGSLLVDAELVALSSIPGLSTNTALGVIPFTVGEVLRETIDAASGTGFGYGYAHVEDGNGDYTAVAGSLDSVIGRGTVPGSAGLADLALVFDLSSPIFDSTTGKWTASAGPGYSPGPGYWPERSFDPVTFDVLIPEPMTISLLGFGVAGLFLRRRK